MTTREELHERLMKFVIDGRALIERGEWWDKAGEPQAGAKLIEDMADYIDQLSEERVREATKFRGKHHGHQLIATQCEEGCECDYLHIKCADESCDYIDMATGWSNCNVDWELWIEEDPSHLKQLASLNKPQEKE